MKHRVRKDMKALLAGISAEAAVSMSRSACSLLASQPVFQRARVVMLYLHIPHELDASELALAAWRDEKTVLAPKVNYEQRQMIAVEIRSLETGLAAGACGILEPRTWRPWPVDQIDLIVVPGLAFDRRGNRLGRGAGFYDRFLSQAELRAVTCGIAFAEQVLDELPTRAHDVPLRMLVTDREVLWFNSA